MVIIFATADGVWNDCMESVKSTTKPIWHHSIWVSQGFGVLPQYEGAYRKAVEKDWGVLAYIHNDVTMREAGWDARVLDQFQDPQVGVVGFGGALHHGSPGLYKTPYALQQLGRSYYLSNVDDAESHGYRFEGECDVAVLDGFSLIVRRELLDKMGGWRPTVWPSHHVYDYRLCCEAHRHGYKVRLVGVRCQHWGGRTATTKEYQEWAKSTQWGSDAEMHTTGHRMIYELYRDVLPWREPWPKELGKQLEGQGRS